MKKFSHALAVALIASWAGAPLSLAQDSERLETVETCKEQIVQIFKDGGMPLPQIEVGSTAQPMSEQEGVKKSYPIYKRIKLEVSPKCSPILSWHYKAASTVENARAEIEKSKKERLAERAQIAQEKKGQQESFGEAIGKDLKEGFEDVFIELMPAIKAAVIYSMTETVPELFEKPLLTEEEFAAWLESTKVPFEKLFSERMKEILPQDDAVKSLEIKVEGSDAGVQEESQELESTQ